jgi:hypothetical protein
VYYFLSATGALFLHTEGVLFPTCHRGSVPAY